MRKIRIGVFFGGRSAEHEISVRSAKSIIKSLDKNKYEIVPVSIDRDGRFFWGFPAIASHMPDAGKMLKEASYAINTGDDKNLVAGDINLPEQMSNVVMKSIDVIFPVLHGPYGEDGCLQGLCKSFNIPFVGTGVLGSAMAMDKDVTKRLLREAGIPCAKNLAFRRYEVNKIEYDDITAKLGHVLFVKPANLGSSVGISKAKSKDEFFHAVKSAFLYDNKILIEEFIQGREIECSVLGNDEPKASLLGEILVKSDFYSYDAKYIDTNSSELRIPADLSKEVAEQIRELAIRAFTVLCCDGMARVDFLVRNDSEIFLNELNTIPGFTEEISMYPKLWEASGLPYHELLDKLITMAIERHKQELALSVA